VAQTAVADSLKLAEDYRVATPALWHNLLIRTGMKDRGLCYHWTEDLMKRLQALNLKTYQLHWGWPTKAATCASTTAWSSPRSASRSMPGSCSTPGGNSGDLYWAAVRKDEYPWEPLPPDQW